MEVIMEILTIVEEVIMEILTICSLGGYHCGSENVGYLIPIDGVNVMSLPGRVLRQWTLGELTREGTLMYDYGSIQLEYPSSPLSTNASNLSLAVSGSSGSEYRRKSRWSVIVAMVLDPSVDSGDFRLS
ncbi:hypothetical protein RIF29_37952 [Crotalaria pallida]|uniref:Uncharacterized protein n=1 Tax=Crotalaria pallida TaxID=3830 RepID=A0AAN9HNB9_CROPI